MFYFYLFFVLPVLTALLHTAWVKKPFARGQLIEIWIGHIVFWAIGAAGVFAFIMLSFNPMADWVARDWVGWATGSPFQTILGWGYLGFGVAGLLTFFAKGGFRWATILIAIFFAVGEAVAVLWYGTSTEVLVYAMIYDLGGAGILALLSLAYYGRVGCSVFWDCHGTCGFKKGKK